MDSTLFHAQLEIFGMNRYHNTIILKGDDLERAEKKAATQEEIILDYMQEHPRQSFTPVEIHLLFGQKWSLNGVRRSLTNLTTRGHLFVTGELRPGLFGVKNNCWQVITKK